MNDTKTKILDAASSLFLVGGATALSVRAIAKQAGISTIGIYSHFQGKQGILDTLYIQGFQLVAQAMSSASDSGEDPVILAAKNYLELAETHEAHYKLIFGEVNGGYSPSKEARQASIEAFRRLTVVVASLLPNTATANEQQDAAMQIWALTHGFVSLKHHAVSEMMDNSGWKAKALLAIELHAKAIKASAKKR